jgi:hypothetical protein
MSVQIYLPARKAKERGETLTRYALIVRDMGTRRAMAERDRGRQRRSHPQLPRPSFGRPALTLKDVRIGSIRSRDDAACFLPAFVLLMIHDSGRFMHKSVLRQRYCKKYTRVGDGTKLLNSSLPLSICLHVDVHNFMLAPP